MGNIGAPELIIILVVVLLLFGSTRLPKLARSLGEATKEFKKGVNDKDVGDGAGADEPAPAADPNEKVTMTKAELDALLERREAEARGEKPPTTPQ